MRVVKLLSLIALAAFLILQGLLYVGEFTSPILFSAIGFIGLAAGILIFISFSHWIEHKKE